MEASAIYERLREIAPLIVFGAYREYDFDNVWDGDGPDPEDEGLTPYVVEVRALTIVNGQTIDQSDYLGSCYMARDEKIDDIHGYLPQMLREATDKLIANLPDGSDAKAQARAVIVFLNDEMRRRYDEQRAQRESS